MAALVDGCSLHIYRCLDVRPRDIPFEADLLVSHISDKTNPPPSVFHLSKKGQPAQLSIVLNYSAARS